MAKSQSVIEPSGDKFPHNLISFLKRHFNDFCTYQSQGGGVGIKSYLQILIERVLQGVLLFFATEFIFTLIFSFCSGFAGIYTSTHVGIELVNSNPTLALYLTEFQRINPLILGGKLLSLTLAVGISAGVIFHFFQLTDNFYFSRGLIGKIICFALPLAGSVTLLSHDVLGLQWQVVLAGALISSLCFFHYCLILPRELVADLSSILRPWSRLSIAWEALRQGLIFFLLAVLCTLITIFIYELLFLQYPNMNMYLPNIFRQTHEYLLPLTAFQVLFLLVKISSILFLTGFVLGVFLQMSGFFQFIEKINTNRQFFSTGLLLILIFIMFGPQIIDRNAYCEVIFLSVIPGFCIALGSLYVGHYTVVNFSYLHKLELVMHNKFHPKLLKEKIIKAFHIFTKTK